MGFYLPPPQALRFQSQAGDLEARETGDEKRGIAARERRLGTGQGFTLNKKEVE